MKITANIPWIIKIAREFQKNIYFCFINYAKAFDCVLSCFNHVRFFETPWTVAHQAPLSVGFSRQEYWSGLLLKFFKRWEYQTT